MPAIRFTDTQGEEDVVALGLPAGRLALVGGGLAGALAILNLPLPEAVRGLLGAGLLLLAGGLAWLHWEGLPLLAWARRGVRFGLRRGAAGGGVAGGWVDADPARGWDGPA